MAQPHAALEAMSAALDAYDDPAALAALSVMTTLTGSALLALAVAHGFLSPADAWRAAHIDEDFEIERWGATRRRRRAGRRGGARWRRQRLLRAIRAP